MDSFGTRSHDHDQIAIPFVLGELSKYGLVGIKHGVEIHDKILQQTLQRLGRNSDMALRDRYKPDLYIVPMPDKKLKIPPLLCEVKCKNIKYDNFAIEFDSYCAAKIWDIGQKSVIYAFVRIEGQIPKDVRVCWVNDIAEPKLVEIPRRFDFDKNILELRARYPNTLFNSTVHLNGSGTPYFLISQYTYYLKSLDVFIKDNFVPKQLGFLP